MLEKYLVALSSFSGCDAVLVPALLQGTQEWGGNSIVNILERLDGLLLTGARSMIDPSVYGGSALPQDMATDPNRDATTLPMAREALKRAVPLLGICRGFQELCCAFGSTLVPDLQKWGSEISHLPPAGLEYEEKYLPTHEVRCVPGGVLEQLAAASGLPDCFEVNSLHKQGVATLGVDLRVEARSIDGLVEAISIPAPGCFALGVQWHPEWHISTHPLNRAIFSAFGSACRQKAKDRRRHE